MTTRKHPNTPWYLLSFHYWGACRDTTPISIRSSPLPASPAGRAMVEQRCTPHASQICGARLQRSHAMNRYTSPVVSSVDQKNSFRGQPAGPEAASKARRSRTNYAGHRRMLYADAGRPGPCSVADQVTVLGIPNGRFWPDTQVEAMAREAIEAHSGSVPPWARRALPPAYFLAVSGGGDNGALVRVCCAAGTIPGRSRTSSW